MFSNFAITVAISIKFRTLIVTQKWLFYTDNIFTLEIDHLPRKPLSSQYKSQHWPWKPAELSAIFFPFQSDLTLPKSIYKQRNSQKICLLSEHMFFSSFSIVIKSMTYLEGDTIWAKDVCISLTPTFVVSKDADLDKLKVLLDRFYQAASKETGLETYGFGFNDSQFFSIIKHGYFRATFLLSFYEFTSINDHF